MNQVSVSCAGCFREPWHEQRESEALVHVTKLCGLCQGREKGAVDEDSVRCATCGEIHLKTELKTDGFICRRCMQIVCIHCGCTGSAACEEGCWWIEPGICSSHEEDERS